MAQRNHVIEAALFLCKIIFIVCVVMLSTFTIVLVYWYVDPSVFSRVDVTHNFGGGFGLDGFRVYTEGQVPPADGLMLSQLSLLMVCWLYVKAAFFTTIVLLILRRITRILKSIHSIQSFYQENIAHFKAMAQYGFIAFAISCFDFMYWQDQFTISLNFAWGPLAFAVACLVLAEVFKEGRDLLEDQKSIV